MKLWIEEEGTAEMAAAFGSADLTAAAAIGYVELRAAMARAVREQRIPASRAEDRLLALETVWARVSEISLERPLLRHAGHLAEQMRLRAYDAVHLAALRQLGEPGEVTFACWDADLRRAARALGYLLLPA